MAGPISGIGSTGQPAGTDNTTDSTSTGTTSSTQDVTGTDTFLKLLVAQMHNQDPMQPMDSTSFVTELAQFNQVEQTLSLNQTVTSELSAQRASEGIGLLGHIVTYVVPSVDGTSSTTAQGTVSGVNVAGGGVQLTVGGATVSLNNVTAVS
jgi:flagellar basal-body rod modification protein FlgD